jgi:hypothetical protein
VLRHREDAIQLASSGFFEPERKPYFFEAVFSLGHVRTYGSGRIHQPGAIHKDEGNGREEQRKGENFSEDVWDAFCTPALRPCLIAWNYGA